MTIKKLLLLSYSLAGLVISSFTAFMTFYIIDTPIGWKMFGKIVVTVLLTLPLIAFISLLLGNYFSKMITDIQMRLLKIAKKDFSKQKSTVKIEELRAIHETLNIVAKELDRSLKELEKKNQELSWAIHSFAHDFRTPLTIVLGNLEAIEDGVVSQSEIPKVLEKIACEAKYMSELLSDLLQYIRSMKGNGKKEEIELYGFIEEEILPLIEDSNILIGNRVEQKKILFSKTDLKKILMNILQNALRYAKSTIVIYTQGDKIIIEDDGSGVEDTECENIFQPFYTVDSSKNRKTSGFGLGLAIARNLADKNDYALYCDKEYKRGCKMVLEKKAS